MLPSPPYVFMHSLGGAVALLTAAFLESTSSTSNAIGAVYTYGSPRAGDEGWAQAYSALGLAGTTFRCGAASNDCFCCQTSTPHRSMHIASVNGTAGIMVQVCVCQGHRSPDPSHIALEVSKPCICARSLVPFSKTQDRPSGDRHRVCQPQAASWPQMHATSIPRAATWTTHTSGCSL